jgi:DNA repair exonuclease SbcCD ATPase subunit
MGQDYTQKTQALSSDRKAFDTEKDEATKIYSEQVEKFNQQVQQFDSQIRELQQWQYTLDGLKSNHPDLFDEIQRAFKDTGKQFDNPVINQKLAALEAKFAETEKSLAQRESKLILDSFEKEKASLSSLEQSWKELGVNVDWEQAKQTWAQTGLKELEQVVRAMYSSTVDKARESKNKVATTQKKVAVAKTVGVGGAARTGTQVKAIDPKLKGLAYASAVWDRYNTN